MCDCEIYEICRDCAPTPEHFELANLQREFALSGLGDRPASMSAEKLQRLTELEAKLQR